MHIDHAVALRMAEMAEQDDDLSRQADALWDAWAEVAHDLGVCLTCEAPSPGTAYCDKHAEGTGAVPA